MGSESPTKKSLENLGLHKLNPPHPLILEASNILKQEAFALQLASGRLLSTSSSSYLQSVIYLEEALKAGGKIILTGIGKSGIIATKISATLTSVGIPSTYLHPCDGLHGDIGCVKKSDAVVVISYSGKTEECLKILPFIKSRDVKIIAICGDANSKLVQESHAWIDASVPSEVEPNLPIPTTSTTLALAIGDALIVNLVRLRQLTFLDFAANHPGGSLGDAFDALKNAQCSSIT